MNNKLLDDKSRKEAIKIARDTLKDYLQEKEMAEINPKSELLHKKRAVFVTLHKNGDLRGCIGNFYAEGKALFKNIQNMAISAAFQDPRFPPLVEEELEEVEIEISVLSPLQKIEDPEIIEVGKHGVMVQEGSRGGVYLPQVAVEQGWDREEMMNHLCLYKAGIREDAWKDGSAEILIFEAEVFGE